MGLDITAYNKLQKSTAVYDDGEAVDPVTRKTIEDVFIAFINPDYPERAEGLENRACYTYDTRLRFRAGSYSGYNEWRNELAKLAGYQPAYSRRHDEMRYDQGAWNTETHPGPFYELINFSDCEGVIGSAVSAKLAKDFADFADRAAQHESEYWREKYNDWRQAFEFAADDGAVSFH